MTTKYPLGVILMELSCQLGLRRACLHARWIPRLQNMEADAITNGDFQHFDPMLRIPVSLDQLQFRVLNELFEEGETYVAELECLKRRRRRSGCARSPRTPRGELSRGLRARWRGGELVRPLAARANEGDGEPRMFGRCLER